MSLIKDLKMEWWSFKQNPWPYLFVLAMSLMVVGVVSVNFLSKRQLCAVYYPEMTPCLCWISNLHLPATRSQK